MNNKTGNCFRSFPITIIFTGIFDRDQSGTIDFREFQQLWHYINQWKGAFDRYDQDRSGAIEGHELHRAFAEMGFNVSANFVGLVLKRYCYFVGASIAKSVKRLLCLKF